MTEEELEAARIKYEGKLVRILGNGRPVGDNAVGVVTKVSLNLSGYLQLHLADQDGEVEHWYIDHHGYTAEIYGGER